MTYRAWSDASFQDKNHQATVAFFVEDERKNIIVKHLEVLPEHFVNNIDDAEAYALFLLLQCAKEKGLMDISIFIDSQNIFRRIFHHSTNNLFLLQVRSWLNENPQWKNRIGLWTQTNQPADVLIRGKLKSLKPVDKITLPNQLLEISDEVYDYYLSHVAFQALPRQVVQLELTRNVLLAFFRYNKKGEEFYLYKNQRIELDKGKTMVTRLLIEPNQNAHINSIREDVIHLCLAETFAVS